MYLTALRFVTPRLAASTPRFALQTSTPVLRTFTSTRIARVGKESSLHEEGRASKVEKSKQEHLRKVRDGENHHDEELASDSEANITADKVAGQKSPEQLQKETQGHAKAKHGQ